MKDERWVKIFIYTILPSFIFILFLTSPVFGRVNINTATKQELTSLPYIGEIKAEAIINYRIKHGSFKSAADIQDVPGIGEKSFLILKPLISVSNTSETPQTQNKPADNLPLAQSIRTGQIMVLTNQQYLPMLRNFIRTAKYRIDIGMYIFKIGKSATNAPRLILNDLIAARKRGVKITIILENSSYSDSLNNDNRRVARILRKNHITVKFDSKKRTTHTKIVIIDDRFAFIGSHNFTNSALKRNNEITLLLDNPRIVRNISSYLNNIR
jgi:competence ComEA-like helix-hairpin-helix protein